MTEMIFRQKLHGDIGVLSQKTRDPVTLPTSHLLTPSQPAQSQYVGFQGRLSLHAHIPLWLKAIEGTTPEQHESRLQGLAEEICAHIMGSCSNYSIQVSLESCFRIASVVGKGARSICTDLVS